MVPARGQVAFLVQYIGLWRGELTAFSVNRGKRMLRNPADLMNSACIAAKQADFWANERQFRHGGNICRSMPAPLRPGVNVCKSTALWRRPWL
jgi:hypothetical protein